MLSRNSTLSSLELGSEEYISSSASENWVTRPSFSRVVVITAVCGTGIGILVPVSTVLFPTTSSMTQPCGAPGLGSRGFPTLLSSAPTFHMWRKCKYPLEELVRPKVLISDPMSRWDLEKDTQFNTFVESASWDDSECLWTIHTREGMCFKARYFLLNTGFAAKRYIPDWEGIETFKGTFLHPSYWPHGGLELKGKRVAIIGTGATGVQLATELSSIVGELVIFQRTPNTALPMKQVNYKDGEQALGREAYPDLFKGRPLSFSGFSFSPIRHNTFDDSPERRQAFYEALWKEGDFKFWLASYQDLLSAKAANDEAYAFWREKTRARIQDPRVRDLLAPMAAPYSFGCKRISLEQGFFEIFNEPHVHLVDVNSTPVEAVTGKGIRTSEKEWEFDYIICATGFDSITGGLKQIDIKRTSGEPLAEYWKHETRTYLGMAVSGFPNMFFSYGPQGPTALCNGPTVSIPPKTTLPAESATVP